MRVIAGRYGGRRLRAPGGAATRPTADRVREALFALLGDVEGLAVLDLFAGSGALGIEALSRGAAHATFVDGSVRAVAAVRSNLAALGVAGMHVRRQDARAFLRNARAQSRQYDLVLLDPPYRHAAGLAGELTRALAPVLADGARVASESDRRAPLDLALEPMDERRYGDTLIRVHGP